jgi:hypothetical protein
MQTDYPWVVCRAADWLDLVEGIGPLVNLAVGPLYTLRGIFRVYTLEGMGQKFFGRFRGWYGWYAMVHVVCRDVYHHSRHINKGFKG